MMRAQVYSMLKAKFLIDDQAFKNWGFIIFLISLAITMIANTHCFEQKIYLINDLGNQTKELRSKFVDARSELMKLKMESTVAEKVENKGIFSSSVPPRKIRVLKTKSKYDKLKLWK